MALLATEQLAMKIACSIASYIEAIRAMNLRLLITKMKVYAHPAVCVIIVFTQGCASINSSAPSSSNRELETKHFYTDKTLASEVQQKRENGDLILYNTKASDRINIISREESVYSTTSTEKFLLRYCPEFTPIAAKNQGLSDTLAVELKDIIDIDKSASNINLTSKLQNRSAGIQFHEISLFSLCVAALNGWLETSDYDDGGREKCIEGARDYYQEAIKGNIKPLEGHEFWLMPDICLTQYERALYRLKISTENILLMEAAFNRNAADGQGSNSLDDIKKILEQGGNILKYLDNEKLTEEKNKLESKEKALEMEKQQLEHDKKMFGLEQERRSEQTKLDEIRKNIKYYECLENAKDRAECKK